MVFVPFRGPKNLPKTFEAASQASKAANQASKAASQASEAVNSNVASRYLYLIRLYNYQQLD